MALALLGSMTRGRILAAAPVMRHRLIPVIAPRERR
jgi:hypothetical protein